MKSFRSILIFLFVLMTIGSGCFPRECEQHSNCIKSCDCLDTTTQTNTSCGMTFLCEVENKSCEAAYDMDCTEFCQTYAAKGVCGSKRCTLDSECLRSVTCTVTDSAGNSQDIPCSQQFSCDNDLEVCETAYILDDLSFCELCLANGTSG